MRWSKWYPDYWQHLLALSSRSYLHGAVHGARVHHVLVEEEGRDYPRVPEELARVPARLVAAEDVLQVSLRDAVHQHLQDRTSRAGHKKPPEPWGCEAEAGETYIPGLVTERRKHGLESAEDWEKETKRLATCHSRPAFLAPLNFSNPATNRTVTPSIS